MGMSLNCPPHGVNGEALRVAPSVEPGHVAGIPSQRLSNLDCRSKLVKRGRKVSYQGFRGLVVRVSRGRFLVGYLDAYDRFTGWSEWVICERLQVVG